MAPAQVRTTVSRIRVADDQMPPGSADGLRALATDEAIDAAVAAFAPGAVDVLGYASTSTGYAIGQLETSPHA
jgi:hypothetical protein